MPMLLISDEQLSKELNTNGVNHEIKVVDIKHGRGSVHQVPDSLRAMIAEEAICGTPNGDVADAFGISRSSVSAYKNGATSTASYNEPNKSLAKVNNELKEEVSGLARQRLMSALNALTDDKISEAKSKDIAGIAKDMSAVMKNVEPTIVQQNNNTQVLIYRPRTKDEDEFDVITVNE